MACCGYLNGATVGTVGRASLQVERKSHRNTARTKRHLLLLSYCTMIRKHGARNWPKLKTCFNAKEDRETIWKGQGDNSRSTYELFCCLLLVCYAYSPIVSAAHGVGGVDQLPWSGWQSQSAHRRDQDLQPARWEVGPSSYPLCWAISHLGGKHFF